MQEWSSVPIDENDNAALRFLYRNAFGRLLCKLLIRPVFSKIAGAYMNSRLSRRKIGPFIQANAIDMRQYLGAPYCCFNDFFTRKVQADLRTFSDEGAALCACADGKLSAYTITADNRFSIKGFDYDVADLLRDQAAAAACIGGLALIFRLTPDDYHRYAFFDDGEILSEKSIKGVLHTVRPIALTRYNVFGQNARVCTKLRTAHFGEATQIEVGALFVGKIINTKRAGAFSRGEEKGMFAFGGSTVILLLQKGKAVLSPQIWANMERQLETVVKMGDVIGHAASSD